MPTPPPPQPEVVVLPSVSVSSGAPGTTYKWNHPVFVFLLWAYFT